MATHIMDRSRKERSVLPFVLALLMATSMLGSAQKGVPQEPGQGQQPPKSGGQSSSGGQGSGVSTGVGVDVGEVIGLFRKHTKVQLQASQQQVRAGDPIVFTAGVNPNRSGLSYEFHWTQDKGSPGQQATTPTINHVYAMPGQYTVNVIVYANGKKIGTSNDISIVVQQAAVAQGTPVPVPVLGLSLQPNQVKSATIVANNLCNQPQHWEIVSQSFPAFMHFTGDWGFDVNAHGKRDLPVQFDSSGLKEGAYKGAVTLRCLTCKPTECNLDRTVVNVSLTVEPPLVAPNPVAGANSNPTPPAGNGTSGPVKTGTGTSVAATPGMIAPGPTGSDTAPQSSENKQTVSASLPPVVTSPAVAPPTPGSSNTAPPASGNSSALSAAGSDHPQQQNVRATPDQMSQPNSNVSLPPVDIKTAEVHEAGAGGTTSVNPDRDGAASLPYSVSLRADSHTEAGKPSSFSADLYPTPPLGRPVRYCFSWGDGTPQSCQESPAATHIYRSRGKYLASVEVFADQEKLATSIQIEAALPVWLKSLFILALVLVLVATAYGTHRVRRVVKGAVSVKTDFGSHKITPAEVESGEGLHIRCVRTAAISKITFSSSDLTQENKETANV